MDGMTRILPFVLTGSCAGLFLIIAAELFALPEQSDFPSEETGGTSAEIETLAPMPGAEAKIDAILERPLFSPGRRPPEVASAAHEEAPRQIKGRLAGVTIRPGVREALFMREGQKPVPVNVGGDIEGWTIAAIEPDRVILSSAYGNQTIKPANASGAVRVPTPAINVNPDAARPAAAVVATARGDRGTRAAQAGSSAPPNPMRNASQALARTDQPGRR
jgi:hypothetical protein